jgi:hypothetical protein
MDHEIVALHRDAGDQHNASGFGLWLFKKLSVGKTCRAPPFISKKIRLYRNPY